MDAVTYPNEKTITFIRENMVPLRLRFDDRPWTEFYNVKWTPAILTIDVSKKEHHRSIGFLPPAEFLPALLLGIAKHAFDHDNQAGALRKLEKLLAEYGGSVWAPEAVYYRGVSLYKSGHGPKALKEAYEKLQRDYPASEWAIRAYPYRLL